MINRKDFIRLAAVGGGAVFLSGLYRSAVEADNSGMAKAGYEDFFFVQLSDSHWGYVGPANPDASNTLKKAVATVNGAGFARNRNHAGARTGITSALSGSPMMSQRPRKPRRS